MRQPTIRVLILLGADGMASDFDFPKEGCRLAALENLRLDGNDGAPLRLLISLTACIDPVARTTNGGAAYRATSGTCSQHLCSIDGAPARWVRTRLRRDVRSVDWRLSILPEHIKGLSISAKVEHVESLSGSVEAVFDDPFQGTHRSR